MSIFTTEYDSMQVFKEDSMTIDNLRSDGNSGSEEVARGTVVRSSESFDRSPSPKARGQSPVLRSKRIKHADTEYEVSTGKVTTGPFSRLIVVSLACRPLNLVKVDTCLVACVHYEFAQRDPFFTHRKTTISLHSLQSQLFLSYCTAATAV